MKQWIIIGWILLLPLWTVGQNVDSLRREYQTTSSGSMDRLEALYQLVSACRATGLPYDDYLEYAREGLQIADQFSLAECEKLDEQILFLNELGLHALNEKREMDSAEYYYRKNIQTTCPCEQSRRKCYLAYINLGTVFQLQGRMKEYRQLIREGQALAIKNGDELHQVKFQVYEAISYPLKGEYQEGFVEIIKALDRIEQIDTAKLEEPHKSNLHIDRLTLMMAELVNRIGLQFPPDRVIPTQENLMEQLMKYLAPAGAQIGIAQTHVNMGNYFLARKEFSRSEAYYQQAVEIFRKFGVSPQLIRAWSNMTQLYSKYEDFPAVEALCDSILTYAQLQSDQQDYLYAKIVKIGIAIEQGIVRPDFRSSLSELRVQGERLKNDFIRLSAELALGNLERALGNYAESTLWYEQVAEEAKRKSDLQALMQVQEEMVKTYRKANDHERAFEVYTNIVSITDSINSARNASILLDYETKYGLQSEKDKNAALQTEKNRLQLLAMGAGMLGLFFALLAFVVFRARARARRDRAHIETLHAELDHRVKNNLNFLNSMVAMQSVQQQAPEAKAALSATRSRIEALVLLHKILRKDQEGSTVSLNEYLNPLIEQLRTVSGFSSQEVEIERRIAPVHIESSQAFALALILNEWLTNAFKYAVPETENPRILVELKAIGNDQVVLVVADNGPGYDPRQRREGSYGTQLVDSQVRQLRADLQADTQNGARYTLTFQTRNTP